ncbi:E3 ubiquitin-protein ligase RNF146-B [Geodia barretti]|uniref:E3 ubiquitin-protein ligase n=1 Tax=Geodia barretti TaxID=519541 RepID=A0AA35SH01_GEOBA|nr:E3 ubiquitin-protein ligase RNF146-B [Geodia barretti]
MTSSADDVGDVADGLATLTVDEESADDGSEAKLLCCVCQEEAENAVKLPCSHIFCFLCVKVDYLENPSIVNCGALCAKLSLNSRSYHWYYEGKSGGWWMYEDRTSDEIEKGFVTNAKSIKVRISGFTYVVDYEKMLQSREDHPDRQRKIKRDILESNGIKGIAGIYFDGMK